MSDKTEVKESREVLAPRRTPKGWRWDVIRYRQTDPVFPGVWDGRQHMTGYFGYARTRWGAWMQIRKALQR